MHTHVVFGAGQIGCYLGSILTLRGFDTRLVARPRIQRALSDGIHLSDYEGHQHFVSQLRFTDPSQPQVHAEVLWLTVKCTAVESVIDELKEFVGPRTVIMCCQNGLGSSGTVQNAFPDNQVLRVMVPFNVVCLEGSRYHRGSEGTLTLELPDGEGAEIRQLATAIDCELMPVTTTDNMQALLWAKLQLNLGNSVNALADIPVKAMLEDRDYRRVIAVLMRELLAVVKAQRISLPKVTSVPGSVIPYVLSLPDWLFRRVANSMLQIDPSVRTSMWWDLHNGRKTEIDFLNGAVVEAGASYDVPTPANRKIISLIKQREALAVAGKPLQSYSAAALYKHVSDAAVK